MKIVKRLLALLLCLTFIIPNVPVYADSNQGLQTEDVPYGDGTWGRCGWGYILGFGQLDEEYRGPAGDVESLDNFIREYTTRRYVRIKQESVVYYKHGNGSTPATVLHHTKQDGDAGFLDSSTNAIADDILTSVFKGTPGNYMRQAPSGLMYVDPAKVYEVMSGLGDICPDLYKQWQDNYLSTNYKPVVLVVEVVMCMLPRQDDPIQDGSVIYAASVSDICLTGGLDITTADLSAFPPIPVQGKGSYTTSRTASYMLKMGMILPKEFSGENNTVFGKFLKGFFGINWSQHQGTSSEGYGNCGAFAVDGKDGKSTAFYVVTCTASKETPPSAPPGDTPPGDTPTPPTSYVNGNFEFDINADKLTANNRGYKEDNSAIAEQYVVDPLKVGYIDVSNSGYNGWLNYANAWGNPTVTLELTVCGAGTGGGQKDYTTNRDEVLRKQSANNIASNTCGVYTKTMSMTELGNAMRDGTLISFDGFNGDSIQSTINAQMTGGAVAVAYACTLKATWSGGPQSECIFGNNQVHYAVYTFEEEARAYTLAQTSVQGWSQLKDNGIATAAFEAQTGTPTTEDLFVSMGGNEYVVNLQYRYCIDDYVRTYKVTTIPHSNFMYYNAGPQQNFNLLQTMLYQKGNVDSGGDLVTAVGNTAYDFGNASGAIQHELEEIFDKKAKEFYDGVKLLLDELDENVTNATAPNNFKEEDYGVLVKAGILSLNSDWSIAGINDAVVGSDADDVHSTIDGLNRLSDYLVKLKTQYDMDYASFDKDTYAKFGNLDINIYFAHLNPDYKDYDSDALSGVDVSFKFVLDNVRDYTNESKSYNRYNKCAGYTPTGSCSQGCSVTVTSHDSHDITGDLCVPTLGTYTPTGTGSASCMHPKACTSDCPVDCSGGHTENKASGTTGASCSPTTHAHNYRTNNDSYRLGSTPDDSIALFDECAKRASDVHYYRAGIDSQISPNYRLFASPYNNTPEDRCKDLFYDSTLKQVYKDVKYMDIIDAHVYTLGGGVVSDMSTIVADTTAADILRLACKSKGFTLYNTQADKTKGFWSSEFTLDNGNGKTVQNAWRAVDQEIAENVVDIDKPGTVTYGANNELATIGRLANSYSEGSAEIKNLWSEGDPANEHGLQVVVGTGDNIEFTYDPAIQGGRSHQSFDGFLKQAIALTFYGSEYDAESAYRNYIQVQSDYLSLDNGYTYCGMMYETSTYDQKSQEARDYGLTQAILCSDKNSPASAIADFIYKSGEFYTIADGVEDVNVNTDATGLNGFDIRGKLDTGSASVAGVEGPNSYTKPLQKYAEGKIQDGYENAGFVRLEKNAEYSALEKVLVNEGGSAVNYANFYSEGKTSIEFQDTCTPIVGYVNKQDSVKVDEHVYEPNNGLSTAFNPAATLVSGGYNGKTFPMYGSEAHGDKLIRWGDIPGASTTSNISASAKIYNSNYMFPYIQHLNVKRDLANNDYSGLGTALFYTERLNMNEEYPGIQSKHNVTIEALQAGLPSGIESKKVDIVKDLRYNDDWPGAPNADELITKYGCSSGLLVPVGYSGFGDNKTNNITIFNPSTAFNAGIIPATEEVPDAKNNYRDGLRDGYTERDQRVGYSVEYKPGLDDTTQTVTVYSEYKPTSNALIVEETNYALKDKSDMPTTYYTVDDYVSNFSEESTATLTAGGVFTAGVGTYKLTKYNADYATSVNLKLNQHDMLHMVGNSVYLERNHSVKPNVLYKDLRSAVQEYWNKKVEVDTKAEGEKLIKSFDAFCETYVDADISIAKSEFEVAYGLRDCVSATAYHLAQCRGRIREALLDMQSDLFPEFVQDPENLVIMSNWEIENPHLRAHVEKYLKDMMAIFGTVTTFSYLVEDANPETGASAVYNSWTIPKDLVPTVTQKDITSDYVTDSYSTMDKGLTVTLETNGLVAYTGDVLHLTFRYTGAEKPWNINVKSSTDDSIEVYHSITTDGNGVRTADVIIEAKQDVRIKSIDLTFTEETKFYSSVTSMLNFEDTWLFDTGVMETTPVATVSTIEHDYTPGANTGRSVNKYLFEGLGSNATLSAEDSRNIVTNKLYISKDADFAWSLSDYAKNNPHKVYNRNWKYYVVGWETKSGTIIQSPNDSKLNDDTTVLLWPRGYGEVTVKTLKEQACLVKYLDEVYITLKDDGLQHIITETGYKVSDYDTFTTGNSLLLYDVTLSLDEAANGVYPLKSGVPGLVTGEDSHFGYTYSDYMYDFFFDLGSGVDTADESANGYLYDVQYSKAPGHRFTQDATTWDYCLEPKYVQVEVPKKDASGNPIKIGTNVDGTPIYDTELVNSDELDYANMKMDYEYDWNAVPVSVQAKIVAENGSVQNTAEFLSLDDEFSIYFDNVADFSELPNQYNASVSNRNKLGYGWNASSLQLLGRDTTELANWLQSTYHGSGMDTTAWIYRKYVTFSHDVYVYTDANGNVDLTLNLSNKKGVKLIKAGTPVDLGRYVPGTGSNWIKGISSVWSDNMGRFIDYGEPGITSGKPYTYNFYLPLSVGERKDFTVYFHSININSTEGETGCPTADVTTGNYPASCVMSSGNYTNEKNDTMNDEEFAYNDAETNVVGRIGALTIVDTGDPRFSDTFKFTDNSDYLIYPVVKRILAYTNNYTKNSNYYTSMKGSQSSVVLDPFDVRGRIGTQWMVGLFESSDIDASESGTYTNYRAYTTNSYDTYTTQWFKRFLKNAYSNVDRDSADVQTADALPLKPSYNKHDTLKLNPIKLGYEIYLSLETIGSYFGYSSQLYEESTAVNANLDYNQNKVQVRPFYSAVNAMCADGDSYSGPVDVYMRNGDSYVLINSGCDRGVNATASPNELCTLNAHNIGTHMGVLINNYFPYYVETNTNIASSDNTNAVAEPDEMLQRRMVTDEEHFITNSVLTASAYKRLSILSHIDNSTEGFAGIEIQPKYVYGCSQYIFLRERNMTYVGGPAVALDYLNADNISSENVTDTSLPNPTYENAQKWYFGLSLPSSAVFVPHGEKLDLKKRLITGYIVSSIDTIAVGNVWTLHYESEVSKIKLNIDGQAVPYTTWNPWYKRYPWLVPITYYDLTTSSYTDMDTQGSH